MAGCLAAVGTASAQTASEVTPEVLAPPQQRLTGALVFDGGTGTQAPPGAEQISISLSGVAVRGGLPQMAGAEEALRARLTSGRIAVSEIFNATADLEAAYANAGFVLSRVILPQQALRDGGQLRIEIVNGFVESVDASAVPPAVQGRIGAVTAPLQNKPGLTQAELERQLLLAGDTPGVALRSALATGSQPGGTVIVLDPEYRPVTGFVGLDNLAENGLGKATFSAGLELNSVLNLGETVYARLSGSPNGILSDDPRYRVLGLGAIVPFGASGLSFNYEYTASATRPEDQITPTRSTFERHSFRLSYPFVRSRQFNFTGRAALDLSRDEQEVIGAGTTTPVYRDELSVLRLGGDLFYAHDNGAFTQAAFTLSRGLDAFGARGADDVNGGTPLSRQGMDAEFSKLGLTAFHRMPLSKTAGLSLFASMQTSFGDVLPTSEQFGIAGQRALSAFDSGALRGDSGWALRAELSNSYAFDLGATGMQVSPYLFAAAGAVTLENPTALEESRVGAHAVGLGVDLSSRSGSNYRSSFFRMEFGKGVRDDGEPDGNRFSISGSLRF